MFRSSTTFGFAVICAHLFGTPGLQAQILLPLERVNSTANDCFVDYYFEFGEEDDSRTWSSLSFFGEWNFDQDSGSGSASLNDYLLSDADSTYSEDWAYAGIDYVSAVANSPDPGYPYYASVASEALFFAGANIDSSDPNETGISVLSYIDAISTMQVEVQSNGDYPDAGADTDSATIYATLTLEVWDPMDGRVDVSVKSSWLTAFPLSNTHWWVEGSISQSTSGNPTASPISIDTTFSAHAGAREWYPTEVSNVGDTITLSATVGLQNSYLRADNATDTPAPANNEFTTIMSGEVLIYVAVP